MVTQRHDEPHQSPRLVVACPGCATATEAVALGHARSGDPIAIAGYLGRGEIFDEALATFADAYANQNERDFERFTAAAKAAQISVESGV